MTPFGNLTIEDTNVVYIERTVNWECRTREKRQRTIAGTDNRVCCSVHRPRGHRLTSRLPGEIQNSQNLQVVITYIESIQYLLQLRLAGERL